MPRVPCLVRFRFQCLGCDAHVDIEQHLKAYGNVGDVYSPKGWAGFLTGAICDKCKRTSSMLINDRRYQFKCATDSIIGLDPWKEQKEPPSRAIEVPMPKEIEDEVPF
jgi:hypothetical protein